jgi:hypothetical protein
LGWQGAWTAAGTSLTDTVSSATPVNGGGNYLSMSLSGVGGGSEGRKYGGAGDTVSLSGRQIINWDFRVDESAASLTTNFTLGTDRYQFFGDSAFLSTSATSNEWFAFASGAIPAAAGGTFTALHWEFYSGGTSSTAFGSGTLVDSGLTLTSGTTYHFTIDTDPATKTYVGTVSDGTTSFTSGTLNWRNFSTNPTASGGIFTAGLATSAAGETRAAALDSIVIVPEPSTITLLAIMGIIGLGVRRPKCDPKPS